MRCWSIEIGMQKKSKDYVRIIQWYHFVNDLFANNFREIDHAFCSIDLTEYCQISENFVSEHHFDHNFLEKIP